VAAVGGGAGYGAVGGGGGNGGDANDMSFYPGDPNDWSKEADDYLHNPDPKDRKVGPVLLSHSTATEADIQGGGTIFTSRGLANIGCLIILALGTLTLFAGYPIIAHYTASTLSTGGAYNLGGINATGQVPDIPNMPRLIDPDTPVDVHTRTGFDGNSDWELVFSDEFNEDGRTFYEGDDPFWQGRSISSSSFTSYSWGLPLV
jgi:hypothetical protein